MATNVFEEKRSAIPKGDSRIVRVDFDKSDIGARKSHISGVAPKNANIIKHVGS